MSLVQLLLFLIGLLRNLKRAESEEVFLASSSATAIGDGQIGKWLWENREEILQFILKLVGMFGGGKTQQSLLSTLDE